MISQNGNWNTDKIKSDVKIFILENFLPNENMMSLKDDDLLFEGGIIDSMGAIMLLGYIENQFKIKVLDEELFPENFASVNRIGHFIIEKMNNKVPSINMNPGH